MVAGQVKDLREPLFDTYVAAQGTQLPSTISMFVKGQSDTKGPHLTNMVSDAELPSPEAMDVYSIRIAFLNTAEGDIIGMCTSYCVRLKVSGFTLFEGTIEYLGGGVGIVTPLASSIGASNGIADPRATFQIPDGMQIQIEAGNRVALEFAGSDGYKLQDGTLGLFMRAFLDGVHTKPIG